MIGSYPVVKNLTRFIAVLLFSLFASIALAGGGSGAGIVEVPQTKSSTISSLKARHKLGMEYALENDVYIEARSSLVISLAADRLGLGSVAQIYQAINREIARIEYAGENGLDFQFLHTAVADAFEIAVVATNPELATPLAFSKVQAAFWTAYLVGFF